MWPRDVHDLWAGSTIVCYLALCLPTALAGAFLCRLDRSTRFRSALIVAVIMFLFLTASRLLGFLGVLLAFFALPLVVLLVKDCCDGKWFKASMMTVMQIAVFWMISIIVELVLIDQGLMHW